MNINFERNSYPYNYFDFEFSQSVLNEYELTSNDYFILHLYNFDNFDFLNEKFNKLLNKEIILSFLELKSLFENIKQIQLDLKLCNNQKQLELTFLNTLNRFEYFNNYFYFNIDLFSKIIEKLPCYKNINKKDNILLNEIKETILDYFVIYKDYYEIIDCMNDTLNSLSKFYNIECYLSKQFDIFLTSEIDLYNSTNNNTLINEPESQNNSNADTGVTGEHKLTLQDRELLLSDKTLSMKVGYIIKEYANNNKRLTTNCNIFINYCNKENINKFTINNTLRNINKFIATNNISKEYFKPNNKELITLIQNIFKNAL